MPHIHEKIDFTAEVYIVYKNKVLLRKHDKYKIWLSVGGHIELDEDPNHAAIREVKEEIGMDIVLYHEKSYNPIKENNFTELIPPQFMNRHRINDNHEHICLVYFAKSLNDKFTNSGAEKSDACRWFTLKELDDPKFKLSDYVKIYARKALETLKE